MLENGLFNELAPQHAAVNTDTTWDMTKERLDGEGFVPTPRTSDTSGKPTFKVRRIAGAIRSGRRNLPTHPANIYERNEIMIQNGHPEIIKFVTHLSRYSQLVFRNLEELNKKTEVLGAHAILNNWHLKDAKVMDYYPINGSTTPLTFDGYSEETTYENFTGRDVWVINRNNITVRHASRTPNPHRFERFGEFRVIKYHVFHSIAAMEESLVRLTNQSSFSSHTSAEITDLLKSITAYMKMKPTEHNGVGFPIRFPVAYEIPVEDLEKNTSLYMKSLDIVLSVENDLQIVHPFSGETAFQTRLALSTNDQFSAGLFYEVVDEASTSPDRYLYIGNEVIAIRPVIDGSREPGVYKYTRNKAAYTSKNDFEVEYSTFKEAGTKFGVYATKEEALTKGDPSIVLNKENELARATTIRLEIEQAERNKELAEAANEAKHRRDMEKLNAEKTMHDEKLRSDLNRLQQEAIATARKHEAEMASLTAKLSAERHRDKLERERLERNDRYDERSTVRKDSSEMSKWMPAIVVGVAAAVVAVAKIVSSGFRRVFSFFSFGF